MSKFYDNEGSNLTQNRKKNVLENLINQQNQSKLSYSHIFIQYSKPQDYMQKQQNSFQRSKQNINNSLLQDIGNIDLEIQKMIDEYDTPINQTQIINTNNKLFNLKFIVCEQNKIDVSKSDFKMQLINKIQNSNNNNNNNNNNNHQKFNKTNQLIESSYQKIAQSMRNYQKQKNIVNVKIIDIPNYNILKTKNQSHVNNSQNIIKTSNTKIKKLSLKINSQRNNVALIKPILKQNSSVQDFSLIQTNLIPNVQNKLDNNVHNQNKNIIQNDNKLEKAVKIYNILKQLVQQHSIFQSKVNSQKQYKNRIIQ